MLTAVLFSKCFLYWTSAEQRAGCDDKEEAKERDSERERLFTINKKETEFCNFSGRSRDKFS